jgi:uncharacterized protein YbaA (DUF1428 family)
MPYVDGMVVPVPTENREIYRKQAAEAAAMFKEYGAVSCMECWGDDVPDGQVTSFPIAVQKKPDETVVFSWITWPSKAARDEGWAKMMQDGRMSMDNMPFDGKRMIYGGFEPILEA